MKDELKTAATAAKALDNAMREAHTAACREGEAAECYSLALLDTYVDVARIRIRLEMLASIAGKYGYQTQRGRNPCQDSLWRVGGCRAVC